MKKLFILLLFPLALSAQTDFSTLGLVKDRIDSIATVRAKTKADSIYAVLVAQINTKLSIIDSATITARAKADTVKYLPGMRSQIAAKPSFQNVSDSVYKKAEMAGVLTDLRNTPVYANKVVMLVGKNNLGDNLGGFYRWDVDSSGTDDMVYLNKLASNLTPTGRWVRVFQRARSTVGGGVLVNNGGVKTLYITGTTDANGEVILNLTDNNLSTGNALFTEIWSIVVNPQIDASGPATAVQSYRKTLSTNLKTLTYGFYKANAFTVVLAAVITPVANVGAGTVVQFAITGINSNG